MNSEDRLSITQQPKETCPLVDKLVKSGRNVMDSIRNYDREDEVSVLHDMLWNVNYYGDGIEGLAEDIRKANQELRHWGEEWKQKALEFETQVIELEDQINIMQQDLEASRQP